VRLTFTVRRTKLIYFPFHSGFLFSTNAFIPSFWSSLAKGMWKFFRSDSSPLSDTPLPSFKS